MVRTSKKVKYKKEQEALVNKLLEILPLEDNGFTLYEMDNDKDRQDKILALTDDIKKYFVYRNIGVIKNKHNSKRIHKGKPRSRMVMAFLLDDNGPAVFFDNRCSAKSCCGIQQLSIFLCRFSRTYS